MPKERLNIEIRGQDRLSGTLNKSQSRLKSFGASVKKNWIGITATIASAGYAIKKAFDLYELGMKAKQIEDSFKGMARSVSIDAEALEQAIRRASGETVNFSNVAGNLSVLMSTGLGMKEMTELMRVARANAQLTGKTVEESFQAISGAVAGGFTVTLKRAYGLNVDLANAMENYAKKTGMSIDVVRKYHKEQAIANEVILQGKKRVDQMNEAITTQYEYIQKVKSRWGEFQEWLGNTLIPRVVGVVDWMASSFWEGVAALQTAWAQLLMKMSNNPFYEKEYKKWHKLWQSFKQDAENAKKVVLGQVEPIYLGTVKVTGKTEKKLYDFAKEAKTILISGFADALKGIETLFSNVFYGIITGSIKTMQDAMRSFGDFMLRMLAQIIAKLIMTWILMKIIGMVGADSGIGKVITTAYPNIAPTPEGSNALGTDYVPKTGLYQLHRGERVVPAHENGQGSGSGNVVVYMPIKAWDASDIMKAKSKIANVIGEAIRENSGLRKVIMNYG